MPVVAGSRIPLLRHHRPTGLAVVTLTSPFGRRRDYYCGPFGSEEAAQKYQRLLASWLGNARNLPTQDLKIVSEIALTLDDLAARFTEWATGYYRRADGTPTTEADACKRAVDTLTAKYGSMHPAELSPNKLRELRDEMTLRTYGLRKDDEGREIAGSAKRLTRGYINATIRRIRQMIRWAESRELVPAATYHRLATVEYLRPGRSAAREGDGLTIVADSVIDATLQHLPKAVAGIVQVMRHTACRCGEAVQICTASVDRTKAIWRFKPEQHKNRHRGKARVVYIDAPLQEILRSYVQLDPRRPWFRPSDAYREFLETRRANRKTKLHAAHQRHILAKRKVSPDWQPGDHYDTLTVGKAIARACKLAKVEHWSPHQLRHTALTRIREQHGIEVAAAIAGHSTIQTTQGYTSAVTESLALRAMAGS